MLEKAVSHTINDLLKWAVGEIESIAGTPLLDAQLIIQKILGKDKLYVIVNGREAVTDEVASEFRNLIEKRKSGLPVQYIIGHQEFMGMDFFVDENVLIPRPDTEPLVESVIEIAKGIDVERLLIMDIGTGSGAITISLAALIDNADLVSVDISKGAIEVAKRNAEHNNVSDKIKFVNSDLFEGLPVEAWGNKFDIIVSNPPYIPSEVIEGLQVEVSQFEPRLALDGGEDGYNYYRRISHEALKYLKKGGFLAFEVGHDQAVEIKKMLLAFGYGNIRFVKDLPGIDRVVIGELV